MAAIVISASELEELEDRLAVADFAARKAAGDSSGRVSAADARAALGLAVAESLAVVRLRPEPARQSFVRQSPHTKARTTKKSAGTLQAVPALRTVIGRLSSA
ncbi:hypothetical protein KGQ20_22355 [Catenulispora sp. NF23]|uniref:hypothetical protein n=1 Tax=Catenulispora pinistramenti TaxID=2705254 RepID=UPI001BAB5233|nr:hypothetical protein [Catenulispora pinistramenti]MBS2535508.1 hypothetical protein [Catenulispora pinistramenti]